jgi:hypothetical protein
MMTLAEARCPCGDDWSGRRVAGDEVLFVDPPCNSIRPRLKRTLTPSCEPDTLAEGEVAFNIVEADGELS